MFTDTPTTRTVTCQTCGEPFTVSYRYATRAKFCSGKCRKAQYGTPCARCGAVTSGSEGRRPGSFCKPCGMAEAHARSNVTRRDQRDEKRVEIERLWKLGAKRDEIAQALGTTDGTISVELVRMRRDGWDVPLRMPGRGRPRTHPDWNRVPANSRNQGRA